MGNCHVPYAVNNYLVKSVLPASHPSRTDSDPPVTPFPIGTGCGAYRIGHVDGSVLNDDSERPDRGSRTPAARSSSSSSQPVAVGCAAGRPGWALTRQG